MIHLTVLPQHQMLLRCLLQESIWELCWYQQARGLAISDNVLYEIVMQKYNKYKKQNQKGQQTFKSFDKLYWRSFQDNVIDRNEYESPCKIFTNYLEETKNESFSLIWTRKHYSFFLVIINYFLT